MADAKVDPAVDNDAVQINGQDHENESELSVAKRVADGVAADDRDAYIAENKELKEKINRLSEQMEKLENDRVAAEGKVRELVLEKNQTIEDVKALAAVSARAAELETELFRLQHDFFAVSSERDDLLGKLQKVEAAFKELERANRERDSKIGSLEQEKALLAKKVENESAEMGSRIRELEEDAKDKVLELCKLENEKAETEAVKCSLEKRLKQLDEKSEGLEKSLAEFKLRNGEMSKEMVSCRKENSELEEKVLELERQLEKEEEGKECNKKGENLNSAWPAATTMAAAAAASTGTVVAAAAIFYLKYARQGKGGD